MTIAKRLILLLAVPLVAILGIGVFTRVQQAKIESRSRFVAERQIPSLATLGNVSRTFAELRLYLRNHLLATNQTEQARALADFNTAESELNRLLSDYADRLSSDDQDRRLLTDYRYSCREYVSGARDVMSLADAGKREAAVNLLNGSLSEKAGQLSKVSADWVQHNQDLAMAAGSLAVQAINQSEWR